MENALILGVIQGLTEFLPVSSSAHLLLFPYIFNLVPQGLAFDVALHIGTFLAAFLYFSPTWWRLLTQGLIRGDAKDRQFLTYLILATIPAAIIGFFAESVIEETLRSPYLASIMLVVFGLILGWADKAGQKTKQIADLSWRSAVAIGFAQALALVPGVSRSGITMTAGLAQGLTQAQAAEFSFLLLAPISFGAALTQIPNILGAANTTEMAIGTLVSFVVGLLAINVLLRYVKKYGFAPYVWYRTIFGLAALGYLLMK
jgi:undecaprenyl-diphosphatase